jgi:transketolase
VIDQIFGTKGTDEIFVLSNGHAGVALYAVLEKWYGVDAEELLREHGVHPCRDPARHIYCSTGSLGMGLSIACGFALGDRRKNVYCMISDGECAEGLVWESLAFKQKIGLVNLKVNVNINGFSAYDAVDTVELARRLRVFDPDVILHFTHATGVDDHYRILDKAEYEEMLRGLDSQRDETQLANHAADRGHGVQNVGQGPA